MLKINRNQFIKAYKQAANYVSKNGARPALAGIHLYTNDNNFIIESTDSYKLFKATLPMETTGDSQEMNLIVKPAPLTWKASKVEEEAIVIDPEAKTASAWINGGPETMLFNTIEERFPGTDWFFTNKQETITTTAVNVGKLKAILKGLSDDDLITVEFTGETKPLYINAYNSNNEALPQTSLLMQMRRY